MIIKKLGKTFLSTLLAAQVKQLQRKNKFVTVAVVGSIGKTTTKLAIAHMLGSERRVRFQTGNYNDPITVPLVYFDQTEPGIFNIPAWLRILRQNNHMLRRLYPYDVVVLELGADGPGQLKQLAYTQPDILVVTALTDEHMAYFKTLDAVATEELSAASFAKQTLINVDDSPARYLGGIKFKSYGMTATDFRAEKSTAAADGGQTLELNLQGQQLKLRTALLGAQGAKPVIAAAAVAQMLGLSAEQITANAKNIIATPGRMQLLPGQSGAAIIDDTYNASPVAVKAALDVLQTMPQRHKIAVLGNMNEMGALSRAMHQDVGTYCDAGTINEVLTIGSDANAFLAPAAKAAGCQVRTCQSPYEAGEYLQSKLTKDTAVLVKGSQNGVFAEETVKLLLADPADARKLVRQSAGWIKIKQQQFKRG